MKLQQINGVKSPSEDQAIGRYFNIKKLNSLLLNQELWFSNVNDFPDKHERTIPDGFFKDWTDEKIKFYKRLATATNNAISAYISCWTKADVENYALWKIYAQNQGVYIITTVRKLKTLLKREDLLMCEVDYIDFTDKNKRYNLPWAMYEDFMIRVPETYKIKPYAYENEIRGIIYSRDKIEGISVNVDLKKLVDKIIISPFSDPKTELKLRSDLCKIFDSSIIQGSIILE